MNEGTVPEHPLSRSTRPTIVDKQRNDYAVTLHAMWLEIRQFLYIAAILGLGYLGLGRVVTSVDALTEAVHQATRISQQVEYMLGTQGVVVSPLDQGLVSVLQEPGSPSPAP